MHRYSAPPSSQCLWQISFRSYGKLPQSLCMCACSCVCVRVHVCTCARLINHCEMQCVQVVHEPFKMMEQVRIHFSSWSCFNVTEIISAIQYIICEFIRIKSNAPLLIRGKSNYQGTRLLVFKIKTTSRQWKVPQNHIWFLPYSSLGIKPVRVQVIIIPATYYLSPTRLCVAMCTSNSGNRDFKQSFIIIIVTG